MYAVADLEILKGGGKNIYFYHRCGEYPSGIEYLNIIKLLNHLNENFMVL